MTVLPSSMEHNAVIRPLRSLERKGVRVIVMKCDRNGFLSPSFFEEEIKRHRPNLIVLYHASNVCGAIQDIEALCGICGDYGLPWL